MANTINVTSDTVIKLIIRRGTNSDRQNIILSSGELGYTLDTKRVFVGDGVTQGGNIVGNINFGIVQGKEIYAGVAYAGDILFQNQTSTGAADNTLYTYNHGEWQSISPVFSLPGTPGPFTNQQGYVNFNPVYFYLDTAKDIFNIYGNLTSYTLDAQTASVNMITIKNQPVDGTDGVNLNALLSGISIAEAYTRKYVGNNYVPLSGQATVFGTLYSTTNISVSTAPVDGYDLTNKNYVDLTSFYAVTAANNFTTSRFLPLSGGTLTNALTVITTRNDVPAVLIQQKGTNVALRIDDTSFNKTPFIIDSFGSVGIGGTLPAGPTTQVSISGIVSLSGTGVITGNIGIGTSTPVAPLHINNSNYGAIQLGNNINGQGFTVSKELDNSFNVSTNVFSSGTKRLKIDQSGNVTTAINGGYVGISTNTPTNTLTVSGIVAISDPTIGTQYAVAISNSGGTNGDIGIGSDVTSGYIQSFNSKALQLNSIGTNNVIITKSGGNVGIGTASPVYKLDVTGNTRITGTLLTTGAINSQGDITAFYSSDERLKDNIKPITSALDKIDNISGVEYDWNTDLQDVHTGHDVGVIAQEIEQVLPEAVITRDNGYKAVNYDKVIPLLLQAIKELKEEVRVLKK
jgi:Chaperone of endosialidase/Major tropism determinant N-terminal domain